MACVSTKKWRFCASKRRSNGAAWCVPREPRTLKRDVKLSCTSPLKVRLMVFVVLGRLLHPQHLLRDGKARHPSSKPNHEILILAEMSPKKKLEKQSCFSCMGNALKTSLVGFQPHGAEKSPLGALTLGSEWLQGGIFDLRF